VKLRLVAWAVMLVVLVGTLAFGTMDRSGTRTTEERVASIGETIGCPTCAGQSVAGSDAAAARNIRTSIRDMIDEGLSDEQIRAQVEINYPSSSLTPSRSGVVGLVWVAPVIALVLAVGGLGYAFYRWRGVSQDGRASRADKALVERAAAARNEPGG
jgi:cytochrome c-type biogenesis protein CcmH/NrfF